MDSYLTIAEGAASEIKIKGSRFLGFAYPVQNFEEAEGILAALRKEHWGANHHCYAIKIDERWFRYSDDGEPSGTAGKPMYDTLVGFSVEKVMVVSVRYFGGTKLGTGGLVKAYSESVHETLVSAKIVETILRDRLVLVHSYDQTSLVMHHISKFDAEISATDYGDDVTLTLAVRKSETAALRRVLVEVSNGQIVFHDAM